eukprot:4498006-Prymnesium_polylepis.1
MWRRQGASSASSPMYRRVNNSPAARRRTGRHILVHPGWSVGETHKQDACESAEDGRAACRSPRSPRASARQGRHL